MKPFHSQPKSAYALSHKKGGILQTKEQNPTFFIHVREGNTRPFVSTFFLLFLPLEFSFGLKFLFF
jgi:hypothetical protein